MHNLPFFLTSYFIPHSCQDQGLLGPLTYKRLIMALSKLASKMLTFFLKRRKRKKIITWLKMSSDKMSLLSANSIPARLSLLLSLLSQVFTLSPGRDLGTLS